MRPRSCRLASSTTVGWGGTLTTCRGPEGARAALPRAGAVPGAPPVAAPVTAAPIEGGPGGLAAGPTDKARRGGSPPEDMVNGLRRKYSVDESTLPRIVECACVGVRVFWGREG
jgi:hypothetical protein